MENDHVKDISFVDAVRYAFPGAILYLYLYFLFPEDAARFASATGIVGFPVVLVVVGTGIYFVYRPLVYDALIERIQCALNPLSYRRRLMAWYVVDFREASRLWVQIRDPLLSERYATLRVRAAGVHMTYLAGGLAVLLSGVIVVAQERYMAPGVLAIIGVVSLAAAALSDREYETIEGDMLTSVQQETLDEIAKRLGIDRKDAQRVSQKGA